MFVQDVPLSMRLPHSGTPCYLNNHHHHQSSVLEIYYGALHEYSQSDHPNRVWRNYKAQELSRLTLVVIFAFAFVLSLNQHKR